jgi:Icc-related predicted phosphoesterase
MPNIACISDIHGNILALKAVLADIKSIGCDAILCTGDLVGYGSYPDEVVHEIESQSIQAVMETMMRRWASNCLFADVILTIPFKSVTPTML